MNKVAGITLAVAFMCGGSAAALAAPQKSLVRGTIESASGHTLVMKTYGGKTENLQFNGKTAFVSVVPGHLKQVTSGEFVGIAATGGKNKLKAMEVVIFPDSMRGAGEGHYAWSVPGMVAAADRHQGASMPAGAPPVQGTMTNGTVTSVTSANGAPPVQGTMTNGTVVNSAGVSGEQKLTVSYSGGKHVNITVPVGAPVVHLVPASRSVLISGAKAFVVATKSGDGKLTAGLVAVGKDGLMPPM